MREQGEVLEHQADAALLRRHEAVGARDLLTVDQHAARRRALDAGGDPEQGRLAAARRPQQAEDLRRRDVEADLVEREDVAIAARHVVEGETRGEGDGGLAARSPAIAAPRRCRRHASSGIRAWAEGLRTPCFRPQPAERSAVGSSPALVLVALAERLVAEEVVLERLLVVAQMRGIVRVRHGEAGGQVGIEQVLRPSARSSRADPGSSRSRNAGGTPRSCRRSPADQARGGGRAV